MDQPGGLRDAWGVEGTRHRWEIERGEGGQEWRGEIDLPYLSSYD